MIDGSPDAIVVKENTLAIVWVQFEKLADPILRAIVTDDPLTLDQAEKHVQERKYGPGKIVGWECVTSSDDGEDDDWNEEEDEDLDDDDL